MAKDKYYRVAESLLIRFSGPGEYILSRVQSPEIEIELDAASLGILSHFFMPMTIDDVYDKLSDYKLSREEYDQGVSSLVESQLITIASLIPVHAPAFRSPLSVSKKGSNQILREELLQLLHEDQKALSKTNEHDSPEQLRAYREISQKASNRLSEIIQIHGWPGTSLVGSDGSLAAWTIAQHADHDVKFQRHCLSLVEEAFQRQEASAEDVAYLTDRVRINEGQKQIYGTQLEVRNGRIVPEQTEDPDHIDERRLKMGLCPIAMYAREDQSACWKWMESHRIQNQDSNERKK